MPNLKALEQQMFDSEVFGLDFYRVKNFDVGLIGQDLRVLSSSSSFYVDAKYPSEQIDLDRFFKQVGFAKVCVQVEMVATGSGWHRFDEDNVRIVESLDVLPETLDLHGENFKYDRFSLDPNIERAAIKRFYKKWISNSLSSSSVMIAVKDRNFCTFKVTDKTIKIDLTSVLDQRCGVGKSLLRKIFWFASEQGIDEIRVITEIENKPAFELYRKLEFSIDRFYTCSHLTNNPFTQGR